MKHCSDRRGFALVITLVITALLVAVVTEFIRDVYVDTTVRRTWLNAQQASLLADSGIGLAIAGLQASRLQHELRGEKFTSHLDEWAQPRSIPADQGTVHLTIEEENGKLDLNSVAQSNGLNQFFVPVAQRLLRNLELRDEPLLNALGDWADKDDETSVNGAERGYYLSLTPAYTCRNGRIETVEELALIRGFTPDVMGKLLPFVTVYGYAGGATININTAPEPLLRALHADMTKEMAQRIVKYRQTEPFASIGDVTKAGIDTKYVPATIAGVQGSVYRIRAKATVGEAVRTVEAVVSMATPTNPKKLYWREF